ncbi:phosphatase PAP2 family protein [Psychrobacillus lasiicapitis]|uniref:Phosphatase PAP2 family protein n=1 Tax=Psychrobacillus lasiicapitis TaxID=1636719 RepID=A0A544T599_9BACI|nr:phosphatase PAP2 family protein [Psychrobacillus lasiicapitis]TQR12609.1 phosphatase PAP2 family protein [Psychrobacillus lasiicapitis]GGA39498.1 phosphatidylglycerophosphatase B [Psychrobacillus lasiicapitis]
MKKWFYPLGLVTLLGFAALYITFTSEEMVQLDRKMSELIYGNQFITLFHYIGEQKFIVIMMLILFAYLWIRSKNYRGMLFGLFSVGVGNVLNQLMKKWVERERPDIPNQLESFSFPSGHAMVGLLYIFTIAYLLAEHQTNKKVRVSIWIGALILTVLIGLSRVAESRHYATDVFAGWMAGYTWFILVVLWYEFRSNIFKKNSP